MDVSATPAIIAVGAVLTGILLAPRALDAPPPVVQEAPIEDDAGAPIIDVEQTGMGAFRMTIDADGTAVFVASDSKSPPQDLLLTGPIDPALVSEVRALRRSVGRPIIMSTWHDCLPRPGRSPGEGYSSDAPPEHHEEAARLARLIAHDFRRKHELARHDELAAVAEGIAAPQRGGTFDPELARHLAWLEAHPPRRVEPLTGNGVGRR